MSSRRLESFSDGVIAIIITIMVLQFKVPKGHDLATIRPLFPVFISYVLSFVLVANYWNNHHHMFQAATKVSGGTLWANAHLLFWLSLIPFATAWMGQNVASSVPVAMYGVVQLCCGVAFAILARQLVSHHGAESTLGLVLGKNTKSKISVAIYLLAIPLAFVEPWIAYLFYIFVAVMWLMPNRRIEKAIGAGDMTSTGLKS
jgi:uncharacterized membrane protein